MSADNWTVCYRCETRRQRRLDERQQEVRDAYGTLPVDDFDALRRAVEEEVAAEPPMTFREDYEFYGAEDGEVTASYSGRCSECGYGSDFRHEHNLGDAS